MQYFRQQARSQAQWQAYRQLELIAPGSSSQAKSDVRSMLVLCWIWRHFIRLLILELVEEQRHEYLDRCWSQKHTQVESRTLSQSLKRLLWLMS